MGLVVWGLGVLAVIGWALAAYWYRQARSGLRAVEERYTRITDEGRSSGRQQVPPGIGVSVVRAGKIRNKRGSVQR